MKIPLVDLKAQYRQIKGEIDAAIEGVLENTAFIKGKYVEEFENNYKKEFGVKHCIGVANGTDALFISLKALGIGSGDEVITVANSWISTSETISLTGAKPIFIDIDPDYYTIDVKKIEEKISSKTKAIIPVHLFGHPANMSNIMTIAKAYGLKVIEDCAQAHLAKWKDKVVGTIGDVGAFSFFPGKNLGAYGDAGGIITNNDSLAEKVRMFANHGALVKHSHKIEGINSRLDGLQASILNVKLKYLDKWTDERIKAANMYTNLLNGIEKLEIPKVDFHAKHVFHLYVIRTKQRDNLIKALNENGISTGIHYPTPLPYLDAYKYLNHSKEDFPVAMSYKDEILSLPMYPELRTDQIAKISEIIIKKLNK